MFDKFDYIVYAGLVFIMLLCGFGVYMAANGNQYNNCVNNERTI